jgi:GNAT superfamily N-acetyltransferase
MGENLIAHMGIEHRVITNTSIPVQIFGLIDLRVAPQYRLQKIATTLLEHIEVLGRASTIDFLVLFAEDHRPYTKNGYHQISTRFMTVYMHFAELINATI